MSLPAEGRVKYVDMLTGSLDTDEYSEIIQCIKENDLHQAERCCLLRLDSSPDEYIGWALLGLVYFLRADVESAGEVIERASRLAPESTLTLNLLGEFLCCSGKHDLGEAALNESLNIEPVQEFPLRMLLHQYVQRRDVREVVRVLFALIPLCPSDEVLWTDLRGCLQRMENIGDHEEECRELAHQFADRYIAWNIHALCLRALGRHNEAEVSVKKALALYGNDSETWTLYGVVLFRLGRRKAAIKAFRKAVLLNDRNAEAWLNLSVALVKAGKRKEAKKAIDRLIEVDPQHGTSVLEYMSKRGE